MSSIKNLEMATVVSTYKNIIIKKSFFSVKAIYEPTQCKIKAMVLEYSATEGERIVRLLGMPIDKMVAVIQHEGKPKTGTNGNFRLEVCLSTDHQFCALQLFRFIDLNYNPLFEPRFYEGKDAECVANLI